ncbi:Cutinase transcription factor 1 alpha like protein [Verticillium longisporum]|uniref:Cutinase transcription factor 1 alpha like protein n=1 Tax=Verticillium longisporum TaxID=100787 RepID=A0A8I3AN72_VERLO|nr:Cutinase transcription factor 1 alpha like protein [Verticillium longisporum]
MSNESSARRILPQSSQMSSFSFAPQQYPQRETQKNYVFVDEHNRHKRLKAYDSSPTATDYADAGQLQDSFRQMPMQQQQTSMIANAPKPGPAMYATHAAYPDNPNVYQHVPYADSSAAPQNVHYTTMPPSVPVMDQQQYAAQHHFPSPPHHQGSKPHSSSPGAYSQDEYQQQDLSDLLGSLKMDEAGSAPYLRNRATFRQEEEPAVEEADDYKSHLPALLPAPGLKIRIPPELMPDDDTAEHYLDLYFGHVHPYVPVLSKTIFYQQWNSNRDAISPLILEAIFAIGGRLADEPAQGQQWLALASNHADAFMDIPRLSTLQALLIILKAREAAPKRGYYYRSWMTVVQCVQMAKDLGLDEHYSDHQTGRPCDSSPMECQLKNRIWQTIFACEVMVGSPQGRTDLAVELDTIDFSIPRPIPGADELEYNISRNFTYLARIVKNISRMNTVYGRLRKTKKDWGVDPDFVQLNPSLNSWLNDLPGDLSVTFPPDGSAPWLSSPFIGNLHSYYYLAQILLHRPQLAFLDPNGADGQWKHHMMICYNSAKALCRLQEAVVNSFGFTGLQCMQRGFSFTIYCGLTCIVLHLVAITSPDPDLNVDARDYFARHMRVLERVMSVWPMADLQKPVDAVREAFSADIRKPFVLKPSFPYGSPHSSNQSPSPHINTGYRPSPLSQAGSLEPRLDTQNMHQQHSQSLVMMSSQGSQAPGMPPTMPLAEAPAWNPQRIFEQWNTSFGQPEAPSIQDIQAATASMPVAAQQMPAQQYSAAPVQTFVTPAMWQESVASVYEGGLKRAWDYEGGPMMKRQR